MDLDYTTEQKLIKDEAFNFLKKECPYSLVKELEESEAGYSRKIWKKMAELGWLELAFPVTYGGGGGQFFDLVLLHEEMGKALLPSPFFSTVIQCGLTILEGGSEEQKQNLLPEISKGKLLMALAQYEEDASYYLSDITMQAERQGGQYVLNGTKMFVPDANIADKLIVVVKTGVTEVSLLQVAGDDPGLRVTKMPTIGMDNTCEVIFKNVKTAQENMLGRPGQAEAILEKMNAKAMLLKAAEMIGSCRACLDMTTAYAKERNQYGKPIGGFQIIQHYLANMLIEYNTCHNYLYRTASVVDSGEDFGRDASALKACVNEANKFISERAVQIHGGIGTTREADVGLFFRKAKSNEFICGDTEMHREKVFESLLAQA
ncbi:MAG: acyl-CoA/acyl-ACP dehydrogenase [Deltaproteobacteria bacterium]|jgi:alkylation response protein AidB-like acyl-CoA dehydrogenase|nr:acyl-CoA/acyl-ACP dehydrogenase [Deltaproteobacteria bacterium]MBT4640310.1 acyl-CoA/acyl-ACP dehydrogenase [Deltaproteobacteria bacterium]MBT6501901.1 acyl-CoA/acyl-ACP dehydrogenase [Deltaproteobacteria bacterium]MBT6615190.1 acyl-CoA/acyl-ACP dehydrogenase [Deltaproteobacteria bacterium]MBT7152838.1 acyl-CoA/acyl-ACP dehydrogenase [Deltaproteobacteria bacterium]